MTKEILSRLDVLAAKLGQTAAALWPHAIRHTAIEGFADIAIFTAFSLLAVALIAAGSYSGSKKEWEEGPWIAPLVSGGVLALMCLLTLAFGGTTSIAKALEPTGYTVKKITGGIR